LIFSGFNNEEIKLCKSKKMLKKKVGFTLIEIMVTIAIIGILAAVVMVSMSSYAKKARASRALAQASSVIPSMISCWGNGGTVNSSGQICSLGSGYGSWPTLPSGYSFSGVTGTSSSSFYFSVTGESQTICCNSAMNSCGMVNSGVCNESTTW